MDKQTLEVNVHREPSGYLAKVRGLEGCLASSKTLEELHAALHEAISLYFGHEQPERILTRLTAFDSKSSQIYAEPTRTTQRNRWPTRSARRTETTGRPACDSD